MQGVVREPQRGPEGTAAWSLLLVWGVLALSPIVGPGIPRPSRNALETPSARGIARRAGTLVGDPATKRKAVLNVVDRHPGVLFPLRVAPEIG